ncbi:hypothetical protein FACS189413_10750 [Bacteroidia bacterium]|nr:hypothetical protein FACS189413_10750 [Bacteroidia bacterium]
MILCTWTKYPVIYLDFNTASYNSVETLNAVLDDFLKTFEQKWGIENERVFRRTEKKRCLFAFCFS